MTDGKANKLWNGALWSCAIFGAVVWLGLSQAVFQPINARMTDSIIRGDMNQTAALFVGAAFGIVRFIPVSCVLWAFSTRNKPGRYSRWRVAVLWSSVFLGGVALVAMLLTQINERSREISRLGASLTTEYPVRTPLPPPSQDVEKAQVIAAPDTVQMPQADSATAPKLERSEERFIAEVQRKEPDLNRILRDPDWQTFLNWKVGNSTISHQFLTAHEQRDLQAVVNIFESFKLVKNAAVSRGSSFTQQMEYEIQLMQQPPLPNAATYQTSFDCAKSYSIPEVLICNDKDLATSDLILAQIVDQARNAVYEKAALERRISKQWNYRQRNCVDRACLTAWYAYERNVLLKIAQTGDVNAN